MWVQIRVFCIVPRGCDGKKVLAKGYFSGKTNFLTLCERVGVGFAIVVLARRMFCLGFWRFGRKGFMYILGARGII